jgi:hypothetical protein
MEGSRRRWVWIAGLLALGLACVYGLLLLTSQPVDEGEARQLATGRFHRYVDAAGIDPSLFDGPKPATAVNVAYGFQWTYSDNQGRIIIYVWVQESGLTEIAIDGETERLRRPRQRGEAASG